MYQLIKFAQRFDKKKLSKFYKYLTLKIKYNKTISDKLKSDLSSKELTDYIL
jgi:hypothetical protein